MKLGLINRGDYPEPIRRELEQLVAAISTSYDIEHTEEGRQRRIWAKFGLGANQSVANAALVTVTCRVPDARNTGDLVVDQASGIVRVNTPGIYSVVGQVRFANNAVGVRAIYLQRSGIEQALMLQQAVAGGVVTVCQVIADIPCEANETLAMVVLQTSGGALALEAKFGTIPETFLSITRVA